MTGKRRQFKKLVDVQDDMVEKSILEEAQEAGITPQQVRRQRLAAMLVVGERPEEIAPKLGVSLATVYRDMKEPELKDLLAEYREQVSGTLIRGLSRMGQDAVKTLAELMNDSTVSAQTRSNIAFGVIDRLGGDVRVAQGQQEQRNVIVITRAAEIVTSNAAQAQQTRFMELSAGVEDGEVVDEA